MINVNENKNYIFLVIFSEKQYQSIIISNHFIND